MKSSIDLHAILGMGGTGASLILSSWNEIAGGIAATATAGYMCLRFWRELKKTRNGKKTICENFSPKKDL